MKGAGNSSLLRPPAKPIVSVGVAVIGLAVCASALAGGREARAPDPAPASASTLVRPDPYPSSASAGQSSPAPVGTPATHVLSPARSHPKSSGTSLRRSGATRVRHHRPQAAVASGVDVFAIPDHAAPRLVALAELSAPSRRVSTALALAMALFAIASGLFVVSAVRRAEA